MALPHSIESTHSWRGTAAPPRLPLALAVPTVDAVTLICATLVVDQIDRIGLIYGLAAFSILLLSGTQRGRINPRLSDDVFPLLGLLAIPILIAAPFAASDA